jgi:hypothetical protein
MRILVKRTTHALLLLIAIVISVSIASPVRAAEMRLLQTAHYRIHTDLDQPLAEELGRGLEAMYQEYSRRLAAFSTEGTDPMLVVYLFRKHEDYNQFTKNRAPNTGGVFLPQQKKLAAYYEGQGRDALRRALQHEAFHQFAYSAISPKLPPWLNEGLAVLFEEGIWIGDAFQLGEVPPRRVRQLRADQTGKRLTDFREFMKISNDRWTDQLNREPGLGAAQYNQAWAMVHFLVFSQENGQFKYRKRFIDMLRLINEGTEPQTAFERAISKNVDGFQSRFSEFIASVNPTEGATLIERQEVLGDMLIELNRMGKRYERIGDFRNDMASNGYRLQYSKNEVKWSSDQDPRVYFKTPDGRTLRDDELYFSSRQNAPLPDLVYRGPGELKLRMRFYEIASAVQHELVVEGTGSSR